MTTQPEKRLWGSDSDEVLIYEDPDEAIEMYLDGLHPTDFKDIHDFAMYEYKPMEPTLPFHCSPLETILEVLDEEYGNPDGDSCEATQAMKDAEQAFLKVVLAEYRPWACEQTGKKVEVNALGWVREHRPDWLKESGTK